MNEEATNKLSEMQFFSGCHWCMANHKIKDQALSLLREPKCSTCKAGGSCTYNERGISQWAKDCIDNNYKHYEPKPPCPKCGGNPLRIKKELGS